ncbi:CAAX amino terminal protease [Orpheovirus IHUMI-LCC2]|uniref:CAAX amino terminal protease n=1 Tax=Orpheovirus IHUMI-LCC2 TaxID=2023057 RepID=A0A2I2L616_9VIRU|nr:CAAX amino terminal protease [Orpheovirus IHUMI-LCC2]SNW62961.1 CAAX amino terminal protease [Orpheovirus IHUMI-LCC2]
MYDIIIISILIFYQCISYQYIPNKFTIKNKNKYFSILLIAVIPNSIIEEIIFYYIYIYGQKYVNEIYSVIISTILFVVWHIPLYRISPTPYKYIIYMILLGISLRLSNIKYNNIISSIISHSIYNFIIIILEYINTNSS